jgi:hypothetical protein
MTKPEVKAALAKARDLLADVEETFEFTCANTNAHLADAMIENFDEELHESRAEVARLEKLLESMP